MPASSRGGRWDGIGSSPYYQFGACSGDRARKRELTRTARRPLDRTECDNGGSRDGLGASTEPSTENPTGPSEITAGRGAVIRCLTAKHQPGRAMTRLSGDTNSDPLPPVLIPTPIMPSCYRLSTPLSGSFLVFTSVSRWGCSGSTFVNLDRINPLLRFSRSR